VAKEGISQRRRGTLGHLNSAGIWIIDRARRHLWRDKGSEGFTRDEDPISWVDCSRPVSDIYRLEFVALKQPVRPKRQNRRWSLKEGKTSVGGRQSDWYRAHGLRP